MVFAAAGTGTGSPTDVEDVAQALADLGRELALKHFRQPLDVEDKLDLSPVTVADREIEAGMRTLLAQQRSEAGIYGEEMGAENPDADELWVLDPIDGTGAFVTGSPLFGCLIGLLRNGTPELGVIEMPRLAERWVGRRGGEVTLNGQPCRSSGRARLAEASLSATSLLAMPEADRVGFLHAAERARLVRFGGDCYAFGLIASGHLDAVVEGGLKPYDFLPIAPVVEAAGGVMTDWSGAPLNLESDGRVIAAASPELHAELMHAVTG